MPLDHFLLVQAPVFILIIHIQKDIAPCIIYVLLTLFFANMSLLNARSLTRLLVLSVCHCSSVADLNVISALRSVIHSRSRTRI